MKSDPRQKVQIITSCHFFVCISDVLSLEAMAPALKTASTDSSLISFSQMLQR